MNAKRKDKKRGKEMRKHKKCVVCKKKYIPLQYYVDIQHNIPHGSDIEIVYLPCGKCPLCAMKCKEDLMNNDEEIYQNFKKEPNRYNCLLKYIKENPLDEDDFEDLDLNEVCDCYQVFDNDIIEGYGTFGDYINLYDL